MVAQRGCVCSHTTYSLYFINTGSKRCIRVFLGAALLTCCSGKSLVHGLPQTVQAFVGDHIILPCSFKISANDDLPSVEWSKEGLQPNVVFLYRHGCETYEMKNPAFEFRTSLITTELKNRNFSLRISNVQLSDAGTYRCMKLSTEAPRVFSEVELVVGAVSEPKLSFASAESGGVALQCEANCWMPEPEIIFLDNEGNYLSADEPKRDHKVSGCYTVTRRLTLQGASTRVTCSVHQAEINQTRTTETLIPVDCIRSSSLTTGIAVGGAISLLLNLCGLAFLLWNKFRKPDVYKVPMTRKLSDSGPLSSSYEKQLLLSVSVDGNPSRSVEKFSGEEDDLMSKPWDTFYQLEISPPSSLHIPRGHIYSDPDVLNRAVLSTLPSKKRVSFDSQFTSSPFTQHGPHVPDLKRRHSLVLPYPISNRFHPLPEHPEETLTSL